MEITVKSLAKKYGVSARDIVRELNDQGFDDISDVNDIIPEDSIELVESYFNDLYDTEEIAAPKSKRNSGKPQRSKGQEKNMPSSKDNRNQSGKSASPDTVTLPSPVIVKDLAEAIGKRPNEIITELIKLGELAGINQAISDNNAKKICAAFGVELIFGAAPKPQHLPHRSKKLRPLTRPCSKNAPRSSPSWAMSTTAKPLCRIPCVTPM